jgi:hypothetical protein
MAKTTFTAKNKFIKELTLSGVDLKGKRASILSSQVTSAQTSLINDLKGKRDQLELKLEDLTDLAPKSTTSLKVGHKEFNATQWVREVHDTKVALEEAELELSIAEETFEEWFSELKEEDPGLEESTSSN